MPNTNTHYTTKVPLLTLLLTGAMTFVVCLHSIIQYFGTVGTHTNQCLQLPAVNDNSRATTHG